MRNRFDQNKDIKDMRVANELLVDGERELFLNQHYQPKKCEFCFGSWISDWIPS